VVVVSAVPEEWDERHLNAALIQESAADVERRTAQTARVIRDQQLALVRASVLLSRRRDRPTHRRWA
jgi:hypothetical protein